MVHSAQRTNEPPPPPYHGIQQICIAYVVVCTLLRWMCKYASYKKISSQNCLFLFFSLVLTIYMFAGLKKVAITWKKIKNKKSTSIFCDSFLVVAHCISHHDKVHLSNDILFKPCSLRIPCVQLTWQNLPGVLLCYIAGFSVWWPGLIFYNIFLTPP